MRDTCDAPQLDECAEDGTDTWRRDMNTQIVAYTCIPTGTYANAHTHTNARTHTHNTFESTC